MGFALIYILWNVFIYSIYEIDLLDEICTHLYKV